MADGSEQVHNAIRFAQLVCALSSRLAAATGEATTVEVRAALEAIRGHFGADQCGILKVLGHEQPFLMIQRVAVPGVPPAPTHIDYAAHFPAVARAHFSDPPVPYVLDALDQIEPRDRAQRETSVALGLGAYVGLPIVLAGEVRYSLALACSGRGYAWPREQVPMMQALGETIANALEREALRELHEKLARERDEALARLTTLSVREREVLHQVVAGRLNKQIASDLGIAESTVKHHRARVMEKTAVSSVAELVRLCEKAGPPSGGGSGKRPGRPAGWA